MKRSTLTGAEHHSSPVNLEIDSTAAIHANTPAPSSSPSFTWPAFWDRWYGALKAVFPTYLAVHLAFVVLSCLSFIFMTQDFSPKQPRVFMLWQIWHRWDTGHYLYIATHSYTEAWRTAFFPLYPLLERGLMFFTHDNPLIAGLLISDVACLVMLMVLYQLVCEDFDHEHALRTVLYISIFPTAFFFAAAYTEALFLCFVLLSFYHMRHGQWWLAGCFGFCASLTRSAGVFLLLPFCYEYLCYCQFNVKNMRFSVLSALLIPGAVGVFSFYCYERFGDWLAFSHAEAHWGRQITSPWWAIQNSIQAVRSSNLLSYQSLHNLLDLGPTLFILALIILSLVGPWRFSRTHWSYTMYAVVVYLFIQMVPVNWATYPLMSFGRYMLMIFPAFIMLAKLGRYRILHQGYLCVAGSTLACLLLLYLIGRLVV